MTNSRRTTLLILLLCSGISIGWGTYIGSTSQSGMADFKAVYFGARCVLQHRDPYNKSEFLSAYLADGGKIPSDPAQSRMFLRAVPICINLPSALLLVTPLATLPWRLAHVFWAIFISGGLLLSTFLMWDIGRRYSSRASLLLLCLLLANCESILTLGNIAGVAVSLCVIAVWCFLKDRFVPAAILCLAISLSFKPHDGGLIWLYFLLQGGVHRKRALQTLAVAIVIGLVAIIWVMPAAPHWMPELRSNIALNSVHGGLNDPGPDSLTAHMPGMIIDLQAAVSTFQDNPPFYNSVSYLVCLPLLLIWTIKILRSRSSRARPWLALAAIVPLTMLITYHRPPDAKLLMLTIPACMMLWSEGGLIARLALLITTAGFVLTADIPLALFGILANTLHVTTDGLKEKLLTLVLTRPASLALLVMAIFYLWVYVRHVPEGAATTEFTNQKKRGVQSRHLML